MTTRADAAELADRLPDATRTVRPDGATAWSAGRHEFLRLAPGRRAVAHLWSGDMGLAAALRARPAAFPRVEAFRFRVAFDIALARIGRREFAELLLDSYTIRCGVRRGDAVDPSAFFA